jgi:5-methylcytosine-specific restriction endonuclease McrA
MLHIVQGDKTEDLLWIRRAAGTRRVARSWIVPRATTPGDEVIIYVGGYGLVAKAKLTGKTRPRKDWPRRYGAPLSSVVLIDPPISLETIRRRLPLLSWAKYPRSVTTPTAQIAARLRYLLEERRKHGVADITDAALEDASIQELRDVAIRAARRYVKGREGKAIYRAGSTAIRLYVIRRSRGVCEGCKKKAPFRTSKHEPYLEPHHTTRLADNGPDHPESVIALCPNCHRRAHYSEDALQFNATLMRRVRSLEASVARK